MKSFSLVLVSAVITSLPMVATAQFVKGNEAVLTLPDGSKRIETHPLPTATLAPPCPATREECAVGGWLMMETTDGLRECTEIYARPGTCRPSTFGTEKRSRLWIVKSRGQWLQCQRPDLASKCVSTRSFPFSEVQ